MYYRPPSVTGWNTLPHLGPRSIENLKITWHWVSKMDIVFVDVFEILFYVSRYNSSNCAFNIRVGKRQHMT